VRTIIHKPDDSHEDRRQHLRYDVGLIAEIHDVDKGVESGIFEVNVINLSIGGLKLSCKGLLDEGSRVLVSISCVGIESFCLAEIVWKKFENKQMSYGLKIIRWSPLGERLKANFQGKSF